MKKALANIKNNYQLYIAALTVAAISACFIYGQTQKAQAQNARIAIEKTR